MRIYGKIPVRFWTHPIIHDLSTDTKLVYLYFIAGPKTTLLGCFRVTIAEIAADLEWEADRAEIAVNACQAVGLIFYDPLGWVLVVGFLRMNKIANPNQCRHILQLFRAIPNSLCFYPQLIRMILSDARFLSEEERNGLHNCLETISVPVENQSVSKDKPFRNPSINIYNYINNININNIYGFGNGFDETGNRFSKSSTVVREDKIRREDLQRQAILLLEFLNEKAHKVFRPVETNLRFIRERLASGATEVQCRQIIAKKVREWGCDSKMAVYLRPATLFNPIKFEQYVGELVLPHQIQETEEK